MIPPLVARIRAEETPLRTQFRSEYRGPYTRRAAAAGLTRALDTKLGSAIDMSLDGRAGVSYST
jgi:hypothetical protein